MKFRQVVGHDDIKQRLCSEAEAGRIPHALMLCGPSGTGKLPMALALATRLLCPSPTETDACGVCPSCLMAGKLAHPDLHFVFPIIRYKDAQSSISDMYLAPWRSLVTETPYFDMNDWLTAMGAENQQALIYTAESDSIQRKLSLKSGLGGRKVMIIWQPEKMSVECANKLLKLIEEPPARTHFILVSETPEQLLPTIVSRTQRIDLPPLDTDTLVRALEEQEHADHDKAAAAARIAHGSYTAALHSLSAGAENELFFDLFVMLMRLSYQRKIKDMKQWADQVAGMGRERQKALLTYCQHLVRENFVYNFGRSELNYQTPRENEFSRNFARFINERNVIRIMDELDLAQRDIEQNVSPKMVFFDFALKMIVLLIQ